MIENKNTCKDKIQFCLLIWMSGKNRIEWIYSYTMRKKERKKERKNAEDNQ